MDLFFRSVSGRQNAATFWFDWSDWDPAASTRGSTWSRALPLGPKVDPHIWRSVLFTDTAHSRFTVSSVDRWRWRWTDTLTLDREPRG